MSVRLMDDIKLNDTSEWTYNDAKYSYSISDEVAAKMNNWIPIGGYEDTNKTFGGEFDGNGHLLCPTQFSLYNLSFIERWTNR